MPNYPVLLKELQECYHADMAKHVLWFLQEFRSAMERVLPRPLLKEAFLQELRSHKIVIDMDRNLN